MRSVDGALLFIRVWTLTAVCRADDDVCSVSCDNVTGTVGSEVTLTCSVSQKCTDCCIIMYKFQYPEKLNESAICERPELPNCDQRNTFTCSFTPTTAMKGQFIFHLQTMCGTIRIHNEFTVEITEPSQTNKDSDLIGSVIVPAVSCLIVVLLIIVTMTVICRKRSCGFPTDRFRDVRADEDNTSPEDVL